MAEIRFTPKEYANPNEGEGMDLLYSFEVIDSKPVKRSFNIINPSGHRYVYALLNFGGYKVLLYGISYEVVSKIHEEYEYDVWEVGVQELKGFTNYNELTKYVKDLKCSLPNVIRQHLCV